MERNAIYRVLPHELEQEHVNGKDESMGMYEAHCGGGTHRSTLRRRGVAPACGGAVIGASPPSTACGGVVAQKFLRARAACEEERASEKGKKWQGEEERDPGGYL